MKVNYLPIYAICYDGKLIENNFCRGVVKAIYKTKNLATRYYNLIKEEKSNYFYHNFNIDKLEIVEYVRKNEI